MTSLFSRLQKLNKEATPGPWQHEEGMFPSIAARPHSPVVMEFAVYGRPGDTDSRAEAEATAALVVECRNSLPAVLNLIEAAQQTVANLAGDAFLHAIDELDAEAFMKALADTRDELDAAVAVFVSGQEEPK